jgi:hypothetical protein
MAKDNDLQEIANSFDLDRILESQFYNDIFFKFESIRKPSEP